MASEYCKFPHCECSMGAAERCKRLRTRPAPAATELARYDLACDFNGNYMADIVEVDLGGYVRYSQAEELLEAERADHDNTIATLSSLIEDNAAKDARIKELEQVNAVLMGDDEDKPRYTTKRLKQEIARATEALEAKLETYHEEYENRKEGYEKTIDSLEEKLAAAEKALEFYANQENWKNGRFEQAEGGTVLRHHPSSVHKDRGAKARAVLGGKS